MHTTRRMTAVKTIATSQGKGPGGTPSPSFGVDGAGAVGVGGVGEVSASRSWARLAGRKHARPIRMDASQGSRERHMMSFQLSRRSGFGQENFWSSTFHPG